MKTIRLEDNLFHKKLMHLTVDKDISMEELIKEFYKLYEEKERTTKAKKNM